MDERIRKLLADAKTLRREATAPAMEVLGQVYRAILATPEFTLDDGTTARLVPLIDPEVGEDGDVECGFDVVLGNGSHLEFTVTNTGWGKSLADMHKYRPKDNGRER